MAAMYRTASEYRRLGDIARRAHETVNSAFSSGVRDRDPARYDALLRAFHAATEAALPSGQPGFLRALATGSLGHIEAAIAFLEADPWFFRSGYEKQALIRHLKRARLDDDQKRRLAAVVVAAIDGRDRREFRHYGRLACAVWSDALDDAIAERMQSADPGIRRRAYWVGYTAIHAGKA